MARPAPAVRGWLSWKETCAAPLLRTARSPMPGPAFHPRICWRRKRSPRRPGWCRSSSYRQSPAADYPAWAPQPARQGYRTRETRCRPCQRGDWRMSSFHQLNERYGLVTTVMMLVGWRQARSPVIVRTQSRLKVTKFYRDITEKNPFFRPNSLSKSQPRNMQAAFIR